MTNSDAVKWKTCWGGRILMKICGVVASSQGLGLWLWYKATIILFVRFNTSCTAHSNNNRIAVSMKFGTSARSTTLLAV